MNARLLSILLAVSSGTIGCQHAVIDFPGVLDLSADRAKVEGDATAFEEQVIIADDRHWALMCLPLSSDGTRKTLAGGFAHRRGWRFITIDEQANPPSKYDWLFSYVRLQVSAERVKLIQTTASWPTAPPPADASPPPTLEAP